MTLDDLPHLTDVSTEIVLMKEILPVAAKPEELDLSSVAAGLIRLNPIMNACQKGLDSGSEKGISYKLGSKKDEVLLVLAAHVGQRLKLWNIGRLLDNMAFIALKLDKLGNKPDFPTVSPGTAALSDLRSAGELMTDEQRNTFARRLCFNVAQYCADLRRWRETTFEDAHLRLLARLPEITDWTRATGIFYYAIFPFEPLEIDDRVSQDIPDLSEVKTRKFTRKKTPKAKA